MSKPHQSPKQTNYFFFKNHSLFNELTENQIKAILDMSVEINLQPGEYLIKEGEQTNDFYLVTKGTLAVEKFDPKYMKNHQITELTIGEIIGEIGALTQEKRTASVVATKPSTLLKISFKNLIDFANKENHFYRIFLNMAKLLAHRTRITSEIYVKSLQKQLDELKIRNIMGVYLIEAITVLCLFIFISPTIKSLTTNTQATSFISISIELIMVAFLLMLIKLSKMPLEFYGLTTRNWRIAIYEGVVFTIPPMIALLLIKWFIINHALAFQNKPLFSLWLLYKPTSLLGYNFSPVGIWAFSMLAYAIAGCFLQEFIARSGIQSPLSYFLTIEHKEFYSIFIANFMYVTLHSLISLQLAALVFFPALFFGWLYYRHKNLFGCTVSHILLGIWAMFIVGIG